MVWVISRVQTRMGVAMVYGWSGFRWFTAAVGCLALGAGACGAQREEHGRNYKPLPPMVHVEITVLKDFNGKPFANAGVVFHAVRNGRNDGNLEVKTDPDGRATIDVIEQGSHVTLQVIARGYATYATEFQAEGEEKVFTVRLQRPRAQVSAYEDNDGKAAQVKPGVQEHHAARPATGAAPAAPTPAAPPTVALPAAASPTAPLQTTPVVTPPPGKSLFLGDTGKPQ